MPIKKFPKHQKGMALIMVLVVLLVLTLVGLSSTDSSNFQALMVRNSQFRLEAYNTSFAEIQTQLARYETEEAKNTLFNVVDGVVFSNTGKDSDGNFAETLPVSLHDTSFTKEVILSSVSGCPIFEVSIGGFNKCYILLVESESQYTNTNINSDQAQQFSFLSF